ncbi:hypothetical protein TRVL_07154 [Trypanosoma vivax]|nr:hypothetical protein TRVL_07154 [Trypanosoma vivax]
MRTQNLRIDGRRLQAVESGSWGRSRLKLSAGNLERMCRFCVGQASGERRVKREDGRVEELKRNMVTPKSSHARCGNVAWTPRMRWRLRNTTERDKRVGTRSEECRSAVWHTPGVKKAQGCFRRVPLTALGGSAWRKGIATRQILVRNSWNSAKKQSRRANATNAWLETEERGAQQPCEKKNAVRRNTVPQALDSIGPRKAKYTATQRPASNCWGHKIRNRTRVEAVNSGCQEHTISVEGKPKSVAQGSQDGRMVDRKRNRRTLQKYAHRIAECRQNKVLPLSAPKEGRQAISDQARVQEVAALTALMVKGHRKAQKRGNLAKRACGSGEVQHTLRTLGTWEAATTHATTAGWMRFEAVYSATGGGLHRFCALGGVVSC